MLNFIVGVLGNLIAAELIAWCPGAAKKIIYSAAKSVPLSMRQRMIEEWSALLDDTDGDLSKLWVAISLYWKRSKIGSQCEGAAELPIWSLQLDTLTITEEIVFALVMSGKSDGEVSVFLGLTRTTVEYYKNTCAEKLSGQSDIRWKDFLSAYAGGHKYSRRTFRAACRTVIDHVRRERTWRTLTRRKGIWKRNRRW
jgi:DNA-binding CsgD family transcriptional regulator